MKKNVGSQVVGAQMVTASDGSAFTGSVTVAVTGDGGTQATGSVGSGACTHEGNGFHTYVPAQAETNYDHVAFTFTGTGAIPVTVQLYTTFPQTGDSYDRLGAPAGASVSADIAALPTAAEINAEVDTALTDIHLDHLLATDYDPASKPGTATALLNELVENDGGVSRFTANALENASGSGATVADIQAGLGIVETTIASLSSQTSFTLTAGSADDDAYNGYGIVIRDASTATQTALGVISDYTGLSKTVTLEADPGIFTMATGDAVILLPATLTDSVWDELQSDHTTAGSFGEIATEIASILVDTAEIGAAGAGLTEAGGTGDHLTALATQASVDTIDGNVDAILVDTGTTLPASIDALPTAAENADAVWDESTTGHTTAGTFGEQAKTDIDAILADTNELQTDDIPGLIAALENLSAAEVNAEVSDVLKTDTIAELVGDPGATPTFEDAVMLLYMALRNQRDTTATTDEITNNAGTTILTASLSDDGTTFSKGEYG